MAKQPANKGRGKKPGKDAPLSEIHDAAATITDALAPVTLRIKNLFADSEQQSRAAFEPVQHLLAKANKEMASTAKLAGQVLEKMQKAISDSCAPIFKDSERAKNLIKWFDEHQEDAGLLELQAQIDRGGPLTAGQVLFLILEARGVDSEKYIEEIEKAIKKSRSDHGKKAAEVRHSQPGGTRDLHKKIRAEWASNKYESRDDCAREICKTVGLSFSATRKVLRNTPDPAATPKT